MSTYYIEFGYDKFGSGDVVLASHSLVLCAMDARTGSVNKKGELVNAIEPGIWYICKNSVDTTEAGMVITPGKGWKIRLYRKRGKYGVYGDQTPPYTQFKDDLPDVVKHADGGEYIFTHYLIHPDGGLGGTKGCIGLIDSDGSDMRERLDAILLRQKIIPVYITDKVDQ